MPGTADGTDMPGVTVCIPAYQAEGFIDRTLWCARRQTHADLRILVSVDRSDDGTEEVCRQHADDDRRVEVIPQQERLGWAANANTLLDRVATEFFFLYFHDDILAPTYVEALLGALAARPDAASAHCDLERFGTVGGIVPAQTFDGPPAQRLLTLLVGPTTGTPLRSLTHHSLLATGLRFPTAGRPGPWQADPYKMRLIAGGVALGVHQALYRRWHREGSLTAEWAPESIAPVIEGQRLQAAVGLEVIDGMAAALLEKELLRFCLYLKLMSYVRHQELRLECEEPAPAAAIAPAFRGEVPHEALAGLEPEARRLVDAAHAHLLVLEGRQAARRGGAAAAAGLLEEALRLNPDHPRAASLLASVRAGRARKGG